MRPQPRAGVPTVLSCRRREWHFLPGSTGSCAGLCSLAHSCLEAAGKPDGERLPINWMISLNMAVGSLSSQRAGTSCATPKSAPSPEKESEDQRKPTWAAECRDGAEAVFRAGRSQAWIFLPAAPQLCYWFHTAFVF